MKKITKIIMIIWLILDLGMSIIFFSNPDIPFISGFAGMLMTVIIIIPIIFLIEPRSYDEIRRIKKECLK